MIPVKQHINGLNNEVLKKDILDLFEKNGIIKEKGSVEIFIKINDGGILVFKITDIHQELTGNA